MVSVDCQISGPLPETGHEAYILGVSDGQSVPTHSITPASVCLFPFVSFYYHIYIVSQVLHAHNYNLMQSVPLLRARLS